MKKSYFILIILLLTVFLIFNSTILLAQDDQEEDTVYINADHLKYEDEKTILTGNITIRKQNTIINAQKGELFREENRLLLEEQINVDYDDGKVNSNKLTALLKADEYIFENQVSLDYIMDNEENMTLNSEYLKIFGDNNSFTAKNNVFIIYEGKNFKGDNAEYNGEEEILYLTGNVLIEEGEDWVKSNEARFFLGEGEEGYTADGDVEIKITLD